MTYQGDNIGDRPTKQLVEIFISEKGLACDVKGCFAYWDKKNWCTKKGYPVKTLESAVNVYNSIFIQRQRKKAILEAKYAQLEAKNKGTLKIIR